MLNSELPDTKVIQDIELKIPLRVYTSEGLLISEFGDERRNPVEIKDFPIHLINAVLSSEDDSFYQHGGIDIKGLIRATLRNATSNNSRKEGASTITMQVARNFFLTPEQTYTRKITEILVAFKLEQILNKDEILSLYLNKIFLGHRAYGFGAASEVYYGKALTELSIAELAMLAGLPKAPSSYNPISNPERAKLRRNYVLGRLFELDHISKSEYNAAIESPVTAARQRKKSEVSAHHVAEMTRAKLVELLGEDVYWQGLKVTTTIKAKEQKAAQSALRKGLQAYDRRHGFRGAIANIDLTTLEVNPDNPSETYRKVLKPYPSSLEQVPALITNVDDKTAIAQTQNNGTVTLELDNAKWAKRHRTQNIVGSRPESMKKLLATGDIVQIRPLSQNNTNDEKEKWALSQIPDVSGALISTHPKTGEIISLVGGYDFFLNKYNRAIQSIRQPGSNIKPFIYSASLDKGFTPASLISGAPIVLRDPTHGTVWRPENYSGKFFGPTRMRTALAKSMNLVSIRLLRAIGIPYARDYTSRFGINMSRFSPTLTMALGSGGATPLEILTAYGALANGGYKVEPYFIQSIEDRHGNIIFQAPKAQLCDLCYEQYLPTPDNTDGETNENALDVTDIADNIVDTVPTEAVKTDITTDAPSTYNAPRVMSHTNNFMTVSMLKGVVTSGTARKALALKRNDLAGKTGTTNDYVDAWFSGFNSHIATTVWVGFDKPKSLGRGEAGGVAALPIWIDFMRIALDGVSQDNATPPEYIEQGFINKSTGLRTDEQDPNAIQEFFSISELEPEKALFDTPNLDDEIDQDPLLDDHTENIDTQSQDTEAQEDGNDTPIENNEIDPSLDDDNGLIFDTNTENQPRIIDDSKDTEDLF